MVGEDLERMLMEAQKPDRWGHTAISTQKPFPPPPPHQPFLCFLLPFPFPIPTKQSPHVSLLSATCLLPFFYFLNRLNLDSLSIICLDLGLCSWNSLLGLREIRKLRRFQCRVLVAVEQCLEEEGLLRVVGRCPPCQRRTTLFCPPRILLLAQMSLSLSWVLGWVLVVLAGPNKVRGVNMLGFWRPRIFLIWVLYLLLQLLHLHLHHHHPLLLVLILPWAELMLQLGQREVLILSLLLMVRGNKILGL